MADISHAGQAVSREAIYAASVRSSEQLCLTNDDMFGYKVSLRFGLHRSPLHLVIQTRCIPPLRVAPCGPCFCLPLRCLASKNENTDSSPRTATSAGDFPSLFKFLLRSVENESINRFFRFNYMPPGCVMRRKSVPVSGACQSFHGLPAHAAEKTIKHHAQVPPLGRRFTSPQVL